MTNTPKTISTTSRMTLIVLGILFSLVGIYFAVGAGMLIARGGS